jgi:hypothetical protein
MKAYIKVIAFTIAITTAQLSSAYDSKKLPQQPIAYTGSCEVDKPQLHQHFEYWSSGKHGSDPNACAYLVNRLIIHREMENYLNRPSRCKINGHTYTVLSGSIYFGDRSDIPNDEALLVALRDATSRMEKAITCELNPEQAQEAKRQKSAK